MDDLLSEFLTETSESLSTLDVELVKLEQNPNDPDILSNIFRLVHTIKGTCGFLGLPRLEAVAHAGENVLGKIRDGELIVTADAVTLVLESIDTIKYLLSELETNETEPDGNDADLIARLNHFADTGNLPAGTGSAPKAQARAPEPEPEPAASAAPEPEPEPEPEPAAPAAAATPPSAPKSKAVAAAASSGHDGGAKGEAHPRNEAKESSVAAQTIRVNVELLENLMTLVSELVLTRNQLLQMVRGKDDSEFTVPLQRLSHITTDLQEGVMKTRMQPIGNAWAKLPRIVRDLALEMGKKIDLQMIGADTELDRQVLELIKDPLTHMVRNSADHGLEDIQGRRDAGKGETGTVTLNAYHEGGHIIIEISDDGRGLNVPRIKEKALANGIVTEGELENMSDQQIHQFIFKPGFSTAEKVTSVSGRGVGMDVVRTNIEKIGGTVELKSVEGRGSTFIIKIPLTLAIVSALIVESGGERFAIPQISVLELVRASSNSEHSIERIHDTPVLRLRNRLLPLVTLKRILGLDETAVDADVDEEAFIVVAQVGTYSFGIIVDRVFDTEEIVVKPVAPILRDLSLFSGNTILGDGSVIMILDPNGIATRTGEITVGGQQGVESKAKSESSDRETTSMLVFRAGGNEVRAVPLALVARLEEIDVESIEYSNGRPLVQYRGKLMPLVFIDGAYQMKSEGRQPTLVFQDRERTMGLVVDEIVDIVDDVLNVELTADRDGLVGSAVVDGKATDLIDAGYYLELAFSDWFGKEEGGGGEKKKVLLVDDSPFFRNLLTPMLSVSGFKVTSVESAEQALELKNNGAVFDAIISDIEMPGMNGFEFAESLQNDENWGEVPIIALSSHTSEEDFERGRRVGFSDYVAKFDRDALVSTLIQTLAAV